VSVVAAELTRRVFCAPARAPQDQAEGAEAEQYRVGGGLGDGDGDGGELEGAVPEFEIVAVAGKGGTEDKVGNVEAAGACAGDEVEERVGAGHKAAGVREVQRDGAAVGPGQQPARERDEIAGDPQLEVEDGPGLEREAIGERERAG
jgi:hypothetical protein